MDATLALTESLMAQLPRTVKRVAAALIAPVVAKETMVDSFFESAAAPASHSGKPPLPDQLQPYCYLYRLAVTGALPEDRCEAVKDAIDVAADVIEGKRKSRMLLNEAIDELKQQDNWLSDWCPEIELGIDPFEEAA